MSVPLRPPNGDSLCLDRWSIHVFRSIRELSCGYILLRIFLDITMCLCTNEDDSNGQNLYFSHPSFYSSSKSVVIANGKWKTQFDTG